METKFVKVSSIHDIPPGQGNMVMAHGKPMALFNADRGRPDHEGGHSVASYEVRIEGEDVLIGWLKCARRDL